MSQSIELTSLLPRGWKVKPFLGGLHLVAPHREDALDLIKGAKGYLKQSAERLRCELLVTYENSDRTLLRIKSTAQPDQPTEPSDRHLLDLGTAGLRDIQELNDAEMAIAIFSSQRSACITTTEDNKIVAANFAVTASHGKPYHQMIGSDLTPLWDVDELARIMRVLQREKGVRELEYWSWKWTQDPDGKYTREKQELVRHAYLISFDGVPCRLTVGV